MFDVSINMAAQKIQVLQIVEDLKIGGLERVIQCLALGLPKDKYEVQVWCLTRGGKIADELKDAGVHVEILGMGERCTLPFFLGLRGKLMSAHIDILHAHGYTACAIGRTAGFLAKVPALIAHVHTPYWDLTRKQIIVEKLLAMATDKILCCSRAVSNFVVEREKISAAKVAVVYNGAADMRRPASVAARAAFGLSPDDFVVGMAASFVGNKGHSCFIEALAQTVKVRPYIKALFAGDGPLRGEITERVKRAGLAGNVVFCGIMTDMASFFSALDLLAQVSVEREGLSISVLEAMSAGRAVIGTKVGGIPEAVYDGDTGILVPPRNPSALASAILALAGDRARMEKMGSAGRELYEKQFTNGDMVAGVTGIYEQFFP